MQFIILLESGRILRMLNLAAVSDIWFSHDPDKPRVEISLLVPSGNYPAEIRIEGKSAIRFEDEIEQWNINGRKGDLTVPLLEAKEVKDAL